ncbi:hypothetical protein SUGI_0432390 [Cryptomeria japonica]|uniref:vacuolar iron transporter homolog 1 n=1 Tax=Cryptomeria japonica TaxID=3369 RepID=UPI00240894B6|nr:vacuolar iron transporter homolog 1 [Cryptomeria japonica]GLJ22922.1 hypothetical protein SUGI_0432390 [Cryptomeria japonica]
MDEKAPSFRASEIEAKELKKIMNELGEAIVHSMRENSNVVITIPAEIESKEEIDFQLRGQWLRAAVLGANDGLVTTASLMMGVAAVKKDSKTMAMSGLAALVAGACSMAIGEYVSVQTQRDAEETNLKREKRARAALGGFELATDTPSSSNSTPPVSPVVLTKKDKKGLPNPILATFALALAFAVGAAFPLVSAAFISDYVMRVSILSAVSTIVLIVFGAIGAYFGRSSILKGCFRVLVGGWLAMLVTYGLLKLFNATTGV